MRKTLLAITLKALPATFLFRCRIRSCGLPVAYTKLFIFIQSPSCLRLRWESAIYRFRITISHKINYLRFLPIVRAETQKAPSASTEAATGNPAPVDGLLEVAEDVEVVFVVEVVLEVLLVGAT